MASEWGFYDLQINGEAVSLDLVLSSLKSV
jgi:hypothetical protein